MLKNEKMTFPMKSSKVHPTIGVFSKESGWVIQKRDVPIEWLRNLEDRHGKKVEMGHLNLLKLEKYYYPSRGVGPVPFMDMLSKLPIEKTDEYR